MSRNAPSTTPGGPRRGIFFGVAAALVAVAVGAPSAHSAVVQCVGAAGTGLCPTSASPCVVTTNVQIEPGAEIDCTGIDLVVGGSSGRLTVTGGRFRLVAESLVVESGRQIDATESAVVETGFEIELSGSLTLNGTLRARNGGRSSEIMVVAGGDISVAGSNPAIETIGTQTSASGGDVFLIAGGDVIVGKRIDASGKEGGTEENINFGGTIRIEASGSVYIEEELRSFGRWFGGGWVQLAAEDSISIVHLPATGAPKGKIVAEGRSLSGSGGVVDLHAENSVLVAGPIQLGGGINNGGGEADGGTMEVFAGCGGVVLNNTIDLTGGEGGGGLLAVFSDGPVLLSGSVDVRGRKLGGDGGVVLLEAGTRLDVSSQAVVNVDGHATSNPGEQGQGGFVLLSGCQVEVEGTSSTGAFLTARGAYGGAVAVEAYQEELDPTAHSLRVASQARIETTGTVDAGPIYLSVNDRRRGVCSNNVLVECDLNSECVFGCNSGSCEYPNPNTEGTSAQFVPAVVIEEGGGVLTCLNFCP